MTVRVGQRTIRLEPRRAIGWLRSEAGELSLPMRLWLGCLGVLLLVGAAAAARSLFPGDKGIGTTPSFEWGLLIVGYVFFAITTSGLCLASALGTVFGIERFKPLEKRHAILAVLCLTTAFGIIALDLHWPVRMVLGAVFNPSPSSPMWWMGVVYGMYFCFLLAEVWSMFTGHPQIHRVACVLSSCAAIVAPSTLGAVFGMVASRPIWSGPLTPVLMLSSAFLSGTALIGVSFALVSRLHLAGFERARMLAIPAIRFLLLIGLVIVALLVAREVVAGAFSSDPILARQTAALTSGPLAVEFWGLRVLGGLAIPLVLLLLPATRTGSGFLASCAFILVGVFADRLTFVVSGQLVPSTAVSGVVSAPYVSYAASLVEIGVLIGGAAFVVAAYTLAERYVDLRESDFHVAISLDWLREHWPLRRRPIVADEVSG